MAVADLFNGERIVVFLFVSRILFSVPLSLSYEAVGICLLALSGFILEIAAERSPNSLDRFKTRRGASSGILLSTITMPAVMLSRLIQLTRALSNRDVGAEGEFVNPISFLPVKSHDFVYMKMQYWTVSMSCLGVLISIYCILSYTSKSDGSSSLLNLQALKFSMVYLVLYTGVCYTSFVTESCLGLLVAMKILWFILHGLACAGLIWHLVHTFPTCVSIGEAQLVSSGLVLYYGDMTAYTLVKISPSLLASNSGFLYYEQRSEISTIIQGSLLGLLLLPLLYKFLLKFEAQIKSSIRSGSQVVKGAGKRYIATSVLFYVSLVILLGVLAPSWMQYVRDFKIHPLLWVLEFILTEPSKRLLLCIYWVSIICICVMRFYNVSKHSKIERILLRKYYHLVAVAMFSPAVIFQPKFLDLAFGAALVVFLVLEMIRVWEIWPLGKIIDQFMNAFTDHRDSDILIISHFSLLLGCALPKWMSSGFSDRPLAPFAGILSLGIGDTMASVVGYKYGVLRWSKSGKKTIEGTAAGITSVLVACSVLLPLLASTGYILSQHWLSLFLAVTVSGLLEAYTAQLDNAFIPLVFYSLLCL